MFGFKEFIKYKIGYHKLHDIKPYKPHDTPYIKGDPTVYNLIPYDIDHVDSNELHKQTLLVIDKLRNQ